jgi:CheY-like chemotaxis protein
MSIGNILIVEDADLVRIALRQCLERAGYQVTTASSVQQTLQVIRTRMPDLIILDLMIFDEEDPLSGLADGFVVLHLLRLNYPEANPSVIIYTINNSPEIESRAKSMGVMAVVEKTSGLQTLLGAIRQALEQRNAGQAGAAVPSST